uniref:Fibrinogen C-terminal domain-containing protein n=1 Tax=Amphimedon queenslandica TaxID=400682 RepID=A0A1X7UZA3_AMPQE
MMQAEGDKNLDYKLRKCSLYVTIGILAVLIALLAGIIRGGGDMHGLSGELVKNSTLLQAKLNKVSMALEKQSKQVEQLKIDTSTALEKQSDQIGKLTLQLKNAIDRIFNVTENTEVKVDDLLECCSSDNSTNLQILKTTKDLAKTLKNMTGNIKNISNSTNKVVDDISAIATELQRRSSSLEVKSCEDIKRLLPSSTTGYYDLGYQTIYCNMDELCGSEGGWTRVAYLDMSNATHNCPTGFRLYTIGGKRYCGRPESDGSSCTSAKFFTNGISYSQICGRVEGYAKASPDAFFHYLTDRNNIDASYVDGVSITHGSPRQHVWTFIATAQTEIVAGGVYNCSCSPGNTQKVPSFVGKDYYCEGGSADPLWDGKDCLPIEKRLLFITILTMVLQAVQY